MADTYTSLWFHIVFSTKKRAPLITDVIRERLFEYMGGIVRRERADLDRIGGMPDHVHLLVRWRADEALSKLLQRLKSRSSRWVHETFPDCAGFGWQDGYAAFSVSPSACAKVRTYVDNQDEHHRRASFRDELLALLEKHEIDYKKEYFFAPG